MIHLSRVGLLATAVLTSACTDSPVSTPPPPELAHVTTEYMCIVDLPAGSTTCKATGLAATRGGPSLDLLLGVGPLTFFSSWVHSRGSTVDEDTSTATMRFINNVPQPAGTTDGTTAHGNGNRLFFTSGPTVTAVSSGTLASAWIYLAFPDGTASFVNPEGTTSYSNRPYYQFNGVVAPGDTSASRTVRYIYSANVKSFSYYYRVSAPVQYEYGWITISPANTPVLAPGGTTTLTGTVYNQVGQVQADGIAWSSSNTAVATVNSSTGVVTAVGQGTATITATSTTNAQRIGTRTIIVDGAPTVVSTTPADGATAVASNSNIVITFSEPVIVSTNSFLLECPVSYNSVPFTVSGSGTSTITLNPDVDLPAQTICTVTVQASVVSDADANDGPDVMALDSVFSFEVAP